MQFQSPSAVQGPVRAPAVGVLPVDDGAAAGAEEATAGEGAETAGADEVVAAAPPAKTPPEAVGVTVDAAGVTALAPEESPADPPLEPTLPPVAQLPLGGTGAMVLFNWTESPGLGNKTFFESTVVHPFPILATNMSGNELARFVSPGVSMSAPLLPLPPVTVTGAQFMYISRLPTLLNHVQAST